jgi:hypothetical protein
MRRAAPFLLLLSLALAACTRPGGMYPSLAPRSAEAIDPRVPIERPINDRPANTELVARLDSLVALARQGDDAFGPAASAALALAESAGPPQSESWIVAQQALSAAIAARAPTARAVGDIDALGAAKLQAAGGIAPNDLKAINEAAALAGAIDARQASAIASIQARLGT